MHIFCMLCMIIILYCLLYRISNLMFGIFILNNNRVIEYDSDHELASMNDHDCGEEIYCSISSNFWCG